MVSPKFADGHPLFREACERRSKGAYIDDIVRWLRSSGYPDLTYRQVQLGLRRAPMDLMLPAKASGWLRDRLGAATLQWNSYVNMRDLAQNAMEEIASLREQLDDPDLTPLREQYLRSELWRWYGRAFDWSAGCTEIALKIDSQGLDPKALADPGDEAAAELSDKAHQRRMIDEEQTRLLEDFAARIPPPPAESLVRVYGGDNVSVPSDTDPDDEEDEDEEE